MQFTKTQFLRSVLLIVVLAIVVGLGPTAWQNAVHSWKVSRAVTVTYPTQYPVKVVTVGKRFTGLTYVKFWNIVNKTPATYQGPFAERLINEMGGLKIGDIVVFKADSTFWHYGKNRELVQISDHVNHWRKIP